jgi:hypothetical protein
MAAIAWMLLILLTVLPLGLQFEIGGVEVSGGRLLRKVSSEITKGLHQSKQRSTISQDPKHTENGDDDDLEAIGSNFEL